MTATTYLDVEKAKEIGFENVLTYDEAMLLGIDNVDITWLKAGAPNEPTLIFWFATKKKK